MPVAPPLCSPRDAWIYIALVHDAILAMSQLPSHHDHRRIVGSALLTTAVALGATQCVRFLIDEVGVSPHIESTDGLTLFALACTLDDPTIAAYLMVGHAPCLDVTRTPHSGAHKDMAPLQLVMARRHRALLAPLLLPLACRACASLEELQSCVDAALQARCSTSLTLLFEHGAMPFDEQFHAAIRACDAVCLQTLVAATCDERVDHPVVGNGLQMRARALIAAIHAPCADAQAAVMVGILLGGCEEGVIFRMEAWTFCDAILHGRPKVVSALLLGCDASRFGDSHLALESLYLCSTPIRASPVLSHAVFLGKEEVVRHLLRLRCNPKARSEDGRETALQVACTRVLADASGDVSKWMRCVHLLLDAGADLHVHDEDHGQSVLLVACAQGHAALARALARRGATMDLARPGASVAFGLTSAARKAAFVGAARAAHCRRIRAATRIARVCRCRRRRREAGDRTEHSPAPRPTAMETAPSCVGRRSTPASRAAGVGAEGAGAAPAPREAAASRAAGVGAEGVGAAGVGAEGAGAAPAPREAAASRAAGVGAEGVGAAGVGAEGVGAEGAGAAPAPREAAASRAAGVGAEGVGAAGVGAEGVGAEGAGAAPAPREAAASRAAGVGAEGVGAAGVGAAGVGAAGVGAEGAGAAPAPREAAASRAAGVGAEGVGAAGVGAEGVGAEGAGAAPAPREAAASRAAGVGAEGVGAAGVGAEGVGAAGVGAEGAGAAPAPREAAASRAAGVGAEGVGAAGVGAEGVGAAGVGAEGAGAAPVPREAAAARAAEESMERTRGTTVDVEGVGETADAGLRRGARGAGGAGAAGEAGEPRRCKRKAVPDEEAGDGAACKRTRLDRLWA